MELARLRADCSRCFGLCCVAPAFSASTDFAIDKPARHACPNLGSFGCGIHASLRERWCAGSTTYAFFVSGQRRAQAAFGGVSSRAEPGTAGPMLAAFAVMRHLHELVYYLGEALALRPAR